MSSIKGINTYQKALVHFNKMDAEDGKKDSQISNPSSELKQIDYNNDRAINFLEFLGIHNNKNTQINELDPKEVIEIIQLLSKEPYKWTDQEIAALVKHIIESSKERTFSLKNLPAALDGIQKAGITEKQKIQQLLTAVIEAAGEYTTEAFETLGELLEAGITNPEDLKAIIKAAVSSQEHAYSSVESLGSYINFYIQPSGITNPNDIKNRLINIFKYAKDYAGGGGAFENIPEAVKAIKANGTTNPTQITEAILTISKAAKRYSFVALEILGEIINAGVTDYNDIAELIETVTKQGLGDSGAIKLLPKNIKTLKALGINKIQDIKDILKSVMDSAGEHHEQALDALEEMIKADIKTPEKISQMLTAVKEVTGDYYSSAGFKSMKELLQIGKKDPQEIISLLKTIKKAATGGDIFGALNLAASFPKANITNPSEIEEIVNTLVSLTRRLYEPYGYTLSLACLLEMGIKSPKDIKEIMQIIIEAKGVAHNRGAYLYRILEAMKKEGVENPQHIKDILNTIVQEAGWNHWEILRELPKAIPSIKIALDTYGEKTKEMIKTVIQTTQEESIEALKALGEFANIGIKDPQQIKELINTVIQSAGDTPQAALRALSTILKNQPPMSFEDLKSNLVFLFSYTQNAHATLFTIFEKLQIDLAKCSYKNFGLELAEKTNAYTNDHDLSRTEAQKISVLINYLGENEERINGKSADTLRTRTGANLSSKAGYQLVAVGENNLRLSSFSKIWWNIGEKIKNNGFENFLKEIDPQDKYLTDFFVTLCSFDKIQFFVKNRDFLTRKSIQILSTEEQIIQKAALMIRLLNTIIPHLNSEQKNTLANFLVSAYKKESFNDYHRSMAYLLKLYSKDLENDRAKNIAADLPEALRPAPPTDIWLADKHLTAKLYFYPDEAWFGTTSAFYKKNGYELDNNYMQENKIQDQNNTVVYKKSLNGITLRVILTKNIFDDRKQALEDESIDIIVHRGHSFNFSKTFVEGDFKNMHKLLIGGSCTSFRSMTTESFLENYGGNYFIADEDTGEGGINNILLDHLMQTIAGKCSNWDVCFADETKGKGIIKPTNPSFIIGGYMLED